MCFQVDDYMRNQNAMEILADKRRVFNFDETAMYLHPTNKYVLSKKGAKNVFNITDNEKECLTVLLGCNAKGECPPSMILFRYERLPSHISASIPNSIAVGTSKSGWMTSDIFYSYITNTFFPWVKENNIQLPIVVFLDGHASHLTLPLCEFCNQNEIILVALPPNSTHIMQPIDVGVIFPFKSIWKRKRGEWDEANKEVKFNRTMFASLIEESLAELHKNEALFTNAFRTCGKTDRLIYQNINVYEEFLLQV